jgi:hypothetical protein
MAGPLVAGNANLLELFTKPARSFFSPINAAGLQLFKTFSAFFASLTRRIIRPFFALGGVAQ